MFMSFMSEKQLEIQIACICAVFKFFFFGSSQVTIAMFCHGLAFLAFLPYDIMVMMLGISIAFLPSFNTFRDGMAHTTENEARLLVNRCDVFNLGVLRRT